MIPDIIHMTTSGKGAPKVEKGAPDPARLISGKRLTNTWNHWEGEDGRLFCGIWESTPGKVKIVYDEWEFCHIISGEVELKKEGSRKAWRFKKGDAFHHSGWLQGHMGDGEEIEEALCDLGAEGGRMKRLLQFHSSSPRTRGSRIAGSALVESLDSRVRGNDGCGWELRA